ncbi:tyrosine-type recombinase/integrase [Janthinobacterium sp. RT4P48]|uniref:tyrosine-type recombinase/integrase n=1 Tax=Janthinobacterium sp. RT4P48 TaxID=3424188 RepID=UPI003F28F808
MNRHRKTNRGLPRRVYLKNGAYRYLAAAPMRNPANGKMQSWIHLAYEAEGESKMLAALSTLMGSPQLVEGSMPHACVEFKENKLGNYGKDTQDAYRRYLDVIADEFEEFHASQVTTKDCAGFLRDNFKNTPNTAKKYAALMSRLFKFIIGELGLRQDNPIDQLDMSSYKTGRREVLATHAQVQAIREAGMMSKERKGTGLSIPTASGPMFACIIDMSYLLWARGIDIRMLKESQIEDGRIRIKPSKTQKTSGKAVDIIVTPEIAEVISRARGLKIKYGLISQFVFPTQKGGAYTRSGLSSMWDRAKERIGMKDDVVFRDIRALAATDAARRGENRSDIQKRLVHTSGKTTDIYIKEVIADVSEIPMALPWLE